jgi:hypothetical protein
MFPRSRLARAFVVIYALVNLGGAIYAAALGEVGHAALHAALLIPVGWLLVQRGAKRPGTDTVRAPSDARFPGRLTNLEQSIDAVAIEVERLVEGQRNLTSLLAEDETRRARAQDAPIEPGRDRSST